MCFHNKLNGFWVAIDGFVHDFTPFVVSWHSGGRKILQRAAGTDCSKRWDPVSHDRDCMACSQLSAHEVGLHKNADASGLNGCLKMVTRCHDAVNLCTETEAAFENFCNSCTCPQGVVERFFGQEFVKHVLSLTREQLGSALGRVWTAKHGQERTIANKMFKINPSRKTKEAASVSGSDFFDLELRSVCQDEAVQPGKRLTRASISFFMLCKKALAEVMAHKDAITAAARTRTFFCLGRSLRSSAMHWQLRCR
jgi:hypothetical protein